MTYILQVQSHPHLHQKTESEHALSYGTKYNHQMYWDGTDFDGNVVEEGTYTFEVRAMLEYEYLNSVDYGDKDSCLEVLSKP